MQHSPAWLVMGGVRGECRMLRKAELQEEGLYHCTQVHLNPNLNEM